MLITDRHRANVPDDKITRTKSRFSDERFIENLDLLPKKRGRGTLDGAKWFDYFEYSLFPQDINYQTMLMPEAEV